MKSKSKDFFCKNCGTEIKHSDKKSLEWHGDVCGKHNIVSRNDVKVEGKDKNFGNEKDSRSSSKILYDFALSKIKKTRISANNSDEVYSVVMINDHIEVLNIASLRAKQWLSYEYSKNIDPDEIHSDDFFKNVLNSIISQAQMNGTEKAKVYNRIAQHDDSIWYDLGTPDWKAIKITKDGIKTVPLDVDSPMFRRSQSMFAQVTPKHGKQDYLEKLADLLLILPEDKVVFKTHITSMFLEAYPIPIMVFDGSAGSIKTTATSSIKAIVDPNGNAKEDNVSTIAEKSDDLILQLYNRYMSSFDNVSRIDDKTSDILCRAITGSSNPKRKLYTDGDEAIHSFRRKIILNGIIPTLEYPDLQTRLLNYPRIEVNQSNRLTEKEFHDKLHELIPYVLGQIFVTLSKTMKRLSEDYGSIRPKERMADFEVWGETISQILGYKKNEFLNRYYEKLKEERLESQDAYPIISVMLYFMDKKEMYEDTASNLYSELSKTAEQLGIDLKSKFIRFPKSSNRLVRDLRIVEPYLKTSEISIESYHYTKNDGKFTKHASIVKISKIPDQDNLDSFNNASSPSSPSSPLQIQAQNQVQISEGTESVSSPVSSPKLIDSRHETDAGEGSEDGEGTPEQSTSTNDFLWRCKTCGAGPFRISAVGTGGIKVKQFHEKLGHEIEFTSETTND